MDISVDRIKQLHCSKCDRLLDISDLEPFAEIECPHCRTRQRVPVKFGAFVLVEELGRGGMGVVYRGYDPSLSRYVAIKVMQQRLGRDKQFVENFLREARAAAALNHQNVVQIYSCGEEKGQPYIVMELVGRPRLEISINKRKPLPESEILRIGRGIAEGLKAGADIGLIHGDIKPANILFDKNNIPKVVDFGLAGYIRQQQEGEIWGTPFYIAPEKARGQKIDERSDIYSLGATLYHALTAAPPFDGDTASDVVLARLKGPPPPVKKVLPEVGEATAALLDRMLSPDPKTRYPTYNSLIADMDAAAEALAAAPAGRSSSGARAKKKKRRWPLLLLLGLAALAAGGLAWWVRSPENVEPVPETRPAAVEAEEPEPAPLPWQPFDPDHDRRIAEALQGLGDGYYLSVLERMESLAGEIAAEHLMAHAWLRFLQAVTAWHEDDSDTLGHYLSELSRVVRQSETPEESRAPITLLREWHGLLEKGLREDVAASAFELAEGDYPEWLPDLAAFLKAGAVLHSEGPRPALELFAAYAGIEPDNGPAWPYGFQPVAAAWGRQAEALDNLDGRVSSLLADDEVEAAAEAIAETSKDLRDAWLTELQPLRKQVAEAEEEMQKRLREERRRERLARRKADLERIAAFREEQQPLLMRKDFDSLIGRAEALESELQTDSGRERLGLLVDRYRRLRAVKTMLIEHLDDQMLPGSLRQLGGRPIAAGKQGLVISVAGGAGRMERPWAQVDSRGLARLAAFVAVHGPDEPAVQADNLLSVVVLCHFYGFEDEAARYLQRAVDIDPDIAAKAESLLPEPGE